MRSFNIIIHGVKEVHDESNNEGKKNDEVFFASLLRELEVNITHKNLFRIGKAGPGKNRQIKVLMKCVEDKEKITDILTRLKNAGQFKPISITDDYIIEDRQTIKMWIEKAKRANEEEGIYSNYTYKVRGSPKNDMRLVKFTKRQ